MQISGLIFLTSKFFYPDGAWHGIIFRIEIIPFWFCLSTKILFYICPNLLVLLR